MVDQNTFWSIVISRSGSITSGRNVNPKEKKLWNFPGKIVGATSSMSKRHNQEFSVCGAKCTMPYTQTGQKRQIKKNT